MNCHADPNFTPKYVIKQILQSCKLLHHHCHLHHCEIDMLALENFSINLLLANTSIKVSNYE